ncbi:hypothetical protein [Methylocystis sp. ATCC 49242]|jgi:hypothetical protein|uniref:hypothetical protein n=1 Tax=Methylocystis sp. ATCC 49242 TaxID=622637 RepID=UPI0001F88298|nr:hypothetical protein [Methylocystis sp. ATCC 49242]
MSALDNLTAAFNDVRSAVALGVERIRQLAQDLAIARASAADAAVIDQIAAELHATADQLRIALATVDHAQPHA